MSSPVDSFEDLYGEYSPHAAYEPELSTCIRPRHVEILEREYQRYSQALHQEKVKKAVVAIVQSNILQPPPETRTPRKRRRKVSAWEFVESWTDKLFRRQFRMHRREFFLLRDRCIENYPGRLSEGLENYRLAKYMGNLAGGFISMEIRLCVTLKMLAGASYLDMLWYGISETYTHEIFRKTVDLINVALPNEEMFKLDYTAETLNNLSVGWSAIMTAKKHHDLMKGTTLAGDGLVVAIKAPTGDDRRLSAVVDNAHFRNRKGCFSINVQAFCDCNGEFRLFDVNWPGATNDITAYRQTSLYRAYMEGKLPPGYHLVLDEAYSSIGGPSHLTPFSKAQLKKATRERYLKMKAFNFILSSQRITIERAFGMLVRKFGILWRPLEFPLAQNINITFVCAKLHKFCLRAWLRNSDQAEYYRQVAEEDTLKCRAESKVFLQWVATASPNTFDLQDEEDETADGPGDCEIMTVMGNRRPSTKRASVHVEKKWELVEHIYDCGIRYTPETDVHFLNP